MARIENGELAPKFREQQGPRMQRKAPFRDQAGHCHHFGAVRDRTPRKVLYAANEKPAPPGSGNQIADGG
jgi:hypothetical protein